MRPSRHPRTRNPQLTSRPPWPDVLGRPFRKGALSWFGALTTYSGGDKPAQTWTNWSGHFSGTVNRSVEPDSLSSLVNIVQQATSTGHQLHVIGSGWAFENIAWSPDWMVSLARLNKQVTYVTNSALIAPWAVSGGGNNLVFHIEAGATIADLNDALASNGLAMPTLGGNVGQAVAGAISTGTHGGDPTQPLLADAVVAMHVVTEGGRELRVERASEPITDDLKLANALPCKDTEIIRDDGIFNSLLVACGRFGVIYSYVLRVRPKFRLAEWTMTLPRVVLTTALRDGITQGTFLKPLLTMLPNPPAALGADTTKLVGLQVVFDTQNLASCYITRRWPTTQTPDLNTVAGANALCSLNTAGVWAAASVVLSPLVAIPFYGAVVGAEMAQVAVRSRKEHTVVARGHARGCDDQLLAPRSRRFDPHAQLLLVRRQFQGVNDTREARSIC